MDKSAQIIATNANTKDTDLTKTDFNYSRFMIVRGDISVVDKCFKFEDRDIPVTGGFILGHPSKGILGTSTLGTGSGFSSWNTVEEQTGSQTFCDDGKSEILAWLVNDVSNHPEIIQLGSGSVAYDPSQTSLSAARTGTHTVSASGGNKLVTFSYHYNSVQNTSGVIREAGVSSSTAFFGRRVLSSDYTASVNKEERLTWVFELTNTIPVMDACPNEIVSWLVDGSGVAPTHVAWGTSSDSITSSTYSSMIAENVRLTVSSRELRANTVWFYSTMPKTTGDGITFRTSALFNASTSGDMFLYDDNPPIEKNDRFQISNQMGIRLL